MKNKRYTIPVTVDVDLSCIMEDLPDILQKDPKKGAKTMVEFGNNGDWSLEYEYLKLLKSQIRIDFGKTAAKYLQGLLDIMGLPSEELEKLNNTE